MQAQASPKQDFKDLLKNGPWLSLVIFTVFNFAMLAYRGGAHYNFYHHYADKAAMFDFVEKLGFTTAGPAGQSGILEWLGYIVHGTRDNLASSNVADVFNSIMNMAGFATTVVVIILSAGFAKRFGKKAVIGTGFALAAVNSFAYYLLSPTNTIGMLALAVVGSLGVRSDDRSGVVDVR